MDVMGAALASTASSLLACAVLMGALLRPLAGGAHGRVRMADLLRPPPLEAALPFLQRGGVLALRNITTFGAAGLGRIGVGCAWGAARWRLEGGWSGGSERVRPTEQRSVVTPAGSGSTLRPALCAPSHLVAHQATPLHWVTSTALGSSWRSQLFSPPPPAAGMILFASTLGVRMGAAFQVRPGAGRAASAQRTPHSPTGFGGPR
jgi:hypothetical protein